MKWHDLIWEHRTALNACANLDKNIKDIASQLEKTITSKGKVIICGNGGSCAHAQHFAAELVVRYSQNRAPWAAVALGSNPAILSAICNDLAPLEIFCREFEAIVGPDDCLVVFSTSGKSPNVIRAIEVAQSMLIPTIAITGINGMATMVNHELRAPSYKTAIIQQIHTLVIHGLCQELEG
jgi:D-sedoheptulose 7-phosphate isomerase